ncbi:MAG: glutamine--fructose-6-phosphate transaminase (isomerizing) [Pseudomonadota bacterium]
MCGIVGVVGSPDASNIMLDALKRLEYRGYDSAGMATLDKGEIQRRRAVGKLAALADRLDEEPLSGEIGVGHTRWATHGAPTEGNAHPHATDRAAVVHNGIIENFRELRRELEGRGYKFSTDTDTETIVALVTLKLEEGLAPFDAARAALKRLEGAFALCIIFRGADDLLFAARQGAPLAIGHGDGAMFVGSDAIALAPVTDRICYLEEGDCAAITRNGAQVFSADGHLVNREVTKVAAAALSVDKGEHRHFMSKEIHEQPKVCREVISVYTDSAAPRFAAPQGAVDWAALDRLSIVACGTAFYAGAVARHWFESLGQIPVDLDIASEFRYRDGPIDPAQAALFISQSGETADTLAAMRHCRAAGQSILSVVNVASSTISREADMAYPTLAGPEIGVASTKAFTCQLLVLLALAALAGRARGALSEDQEAGLVEALRAAPDAMASVLAHEKSIAAIAAEVVRSRDILYLGRGPMYPLALEGALKLKEISYLHAEGFASGELKHGPIALISDDVPVVVLAPRDALFEKTVSNMQEVMARGGRILLISDRDGIEQAGYGVWRSIEMPTLDPMIAPIVYALPVQLLAYHGAVHKGTDVDQPRNLAKSVTVE